MAGKGPLEGKSYSEILALDPSTVVNPAYEPEYQIALADAICLARMIQNLPIPGQILAYLSESEAVNSEEVLDLAELWNTTVKTPIMVEHMGEMARTTMMRSIAKISPRVYSEVREYQVFAAASAIVTAPHFS